VSEAARVTLLCVGPPPEDGSAAAVPGAEVVPLSTLSAAADALERADGWVGFVDPADAVAAHALERLAELLRRRPGVELVYSDEATHAGNGSRPPFHKPAWSPDRLRCQPYTGRLTLFTADVARRAGGLRPELASCAEYDLVLRIGERATAVANVPEVLCLRRAGPLPYPAFDPAGIDLACRVVDEHLGRVGLQAAARPHPRAPGLLQLEPRLRAQPRVSIVIPTGGGRRHVRGTETNLVLNCVESIVARSTYPDIEIVCVTDAGVDDDTRRDLAGHATVRLVEHDGPFHFSRKVNRGVLAATGEVVVILNDDTEVQTPGWLEAMLLYALAPGVGAVGARLLFEDGRIQHMGVVGVGGNPGHPYYGLAGDTPGHGANALVPGDFLAVTGACLMARRARFLDVGGMSSWFPGSYNDLDYCLKLIATGDRIVATPDAILTHFESSSRDGSVATEELTNIRRRWGRLLRADPYYNQNFKSGIADYVP
jgi:O-antigen biosynthesis protein